MNMLQQSNDLKNELLKHLKTTHIEDVHSLWAQAKTYYQNKLIVMGGSYASWGEKITVKLSIDDNRFSFDVSLTELN